MWYNFVNTEIARRECIKCSLDCLSTPASSLFVNQNEFNSEAISYIMSNTTNFYSSGELIDCSDLILHGVDVCPGASGRICVIHDYTLNTLYWQLTDKAERSGCSAVIVFGDYEHVPNHEPCASAHSYDHIGIPFVCISYNDGNLLLDEHISSTSIANVSTDYFWLLCSPDARGDQCSDSIPCVNSTDFCNYGRKVENGVYVEGWCRPCSEDPLYCYFDPNGGFPRHPEFVKSCVQTCDAEIYFER